MIPVKSLCSAVSNSVIAACFTRLDIEDSITPDNHFTASVAVFFSRFFFTAVLS